MLALLKYTMWSVQKHVRAKKNSTVILFWRQSRRRGTMRASGRAGRQAFVLGAQLGLGFTPGRIEGDAADRAHLLALRLVEVADALGAFVRVDFVNFRAHVDRVVRALGLAYVAIDTVVGDHQCHGRLALLYGRGQHVSGDFLVQPAIDE